MHASRMAKPSGWAGALLDTTDRMQPGRRSDLQVVLFNKREVVAVGNDGALVLRPAAEVLSRGRVDAVRDDSLICCLIVLCMAVRVVFSMEQRADRLSWQARCI